MKKAPQLVVFDMAGTSIQEHNLVYKTILKSFLYHNISISIDKVLEIAAGKEKLTAIMDILAFKGYELDSHLIDSIYLYFKEQLASSYKTELIEPMHQIVEVFDYLRNLDIFIALNTGYDSATAHQILDRIHWKQGVDYDLLITASDVQKARPYPDMILAAMRHFKINDPSYVVKVGDSIIDIEEGKNAQCGFVIGMTTGAHTYNQLLQAQPDIILKNPIDLLLHI
jgi:phosphonatase-like hydrolase